MIKATRFFFSSKCSLFRNANLFGSCSIHILYTGCAKIKRNNSGAKGLIATCSPLGEGGMSWRRFRAELMAKRKYIQGILQGA